MVIPRTAPSRLLVLGGVLLAGAIAGCGGISYGGKQHSTTTSGRAQARQGGQQQTLMPTPSAVKPSRSAVKTHTAKTREPKTAQSTPAVAVAPQPRTSTPKPANHPPAVAVAPQPKKSTPKTMNRPPAVAAAPQPRSEIPQGNGGDGDPDNNGAPSDGDGGI